MNGYYHGKKSEREELPACGLLRPSESSSLFLLWDDGTTKPVRFWPVEHGTLLQYCTAEGFLAAAAVNLLHNQSKKEKKKKKKNASNQKYEHEIASFHY